MSKPRRTRRVVVPTKLLMCEGITDKRLAECLKNMLMTRTSGFSVKLDEAGGGGPKAAILAAINHAGDFDKRIVFIDSDLPITKDAIDLANRYEIKIIQSAPLCLEGFLMRLMGNQSEFSNSQDAKDKFHRHYGLSNVVTQEWYEDNVTIQHIDSVINNSRHVCQKIMDELCNVFKSF